MFGLRANYPMAKNRFSHEEAHMLLVHLFVYFVCSVFFFSSLSVKGWLWILIVALPGICSSVSGTDKKGIL